MSMMVFGEEKKSNLMHPGIASPTSHKEINLNRIESQIAKEEIKKRERKNLIRSNMYKILKVPPDEAVLTQQFEEYHQSEEEIKLRKNLQDFERKMNKEKRREERKNQQKKLEEEKNNKEKPDDEENEKGEDCNAEEEEDDDVNENKEAKEKKKSNKPKEQKRGEKKHQNNDNHLKEGNQMFDENNDTSSSVTSKTSSSTLRTFYSMRAAIDEKYIPQSVHSMGITAILVFVLAASIASNLNKINLLAVIFAMETYLFDNIHICIQSIKSSEQRLSYLIDIDLQIVTMMLITADEKQHLANPNLGPNQSFVFASTVVEEASFANAAGILSTDSSKLNNAQTSVSLNIQQISSNGQTDIDSANIELKYLNVPVQGTNFTYTIWQSVTEIVISANRIAVMNILQVDDTSDPSVYFVVNNTLNSLFIALQQSANDIKEETKSSLQFDLTIFLILLIIATVILVFSSIVVVPVISKVSKTKQEVLELFMLIKKREANKLLEKCRKFIGCFQVNQESELNMQDPVEGQQEDGEVGDLQFKPGWEKNHALSGNRRKFKSLNLNIGLSFFKVLFLILIMESYFMMNYFLSTTFLNQVSSLTDELFQLISRLPMHSLLLLSEEYNCLINTIFYRLIIYKDYNISMMNMPSMTFISLFYIQFYNEEDELLEVSNICLMKIDVFSKLRLSYRQLQYKFQKHNIFKCLPLFT